MMMNENCPCKKKKCIRHGKCDECKKHHAESKARMPVYCERENRQKLPLPLEKPERKCYHIFYGDIAQPVRAHVSHA